MFAVTGVWIFWKMSLRLPECQKAEDFTENGDIDSQNVPARRKILMQLDLISKYFYFILKKSSMQKFLAQSFERVWK